MNRLSILLLLSFLSVSSANATLVESSDISIGANSVSNIMLDMDSDANSETTLSKFSKTSPQTDSVPPTSWVIGLGLCLIFLGYKMKNKAH